MPTLRILGRALAGLSACALIAGTAHADPVAFGPNDVQTLFFIAKSNNRDRVDYGMRLDATCHPVGSDPVFPYWRDLEQSPASVHTLGTMARLAYGVSSQHVEKKTDASTEHKVALKQVDRPIWVTASKAEGGRCKVVARTKIGSVDRAELVSIYVKLAGPMSVEYVEVKGKNPTTGEPLVERIKN